MPHPRPNKPNQTRPVVSLPAVSKVEPSNLCQKRKMPLPHVPGGDRSARSGVAWRIGMTRGARRDDFGGARRGKGHSRRYQAGDPENYAYVGSETIVSTYGCSSWCVAAVSCHSGLGSCEGCSCWLWPSDHDCDSCDWSDGCWDWLPGFTALIILSNRSQNIFNLLQEIAFCRVISAFKPFLCVLKGILGNFLQELYRRNGIFWAKKPAVAAVGEAKQSRQRDSRPAGGGRMAAKQILGPSII